MQWSPIFAFTFFVVEVIFLLENNSRVGDQYKNIIFTMKKNAPGRFFLKKLFYMKIVNNAQTFWKFRMSFGMALTALVLNGCSPGSRDAEPAATAAATALAPTPTPATARETAPATTPVTTPVTT
ncbi:hypothetical protein, partial [Robbsia andropogonis]|uniref:hypothetical protein n=1 Tax=Robbsia andropogonis TaxID=28092 RepID=UPI001642EB2B